MGRLIGRVLSLLVLLTLSTVIVGSALDPSFEPRTQHYESDADDAGHVGKVFVHGVEPAVVEVLTFVPSATTRRLTQSDTVRPPDLAHKPLGARAPPA